MEGAGEPASLPDALPTSLHVKPTMRPVGIGLAVLAAAVTYAWLFRAGGLLRLPLALGGSGLAGWLVFKVVAWQEPVVLSASGIRRGTGRAARFAAWGDIAQANHIKTWPDSLALGNNKLAFRNGVKLDLRDGTWLFIPDCDELGGQELLAAVRTHMATVRPLSAPA